MPVKTITCFLLSFLTAFHAYSQKFDTIKTIPAKDRAPQALLIYKLNYRHIDSTAAFTKLKELSSIAAELHDKTLDCVVLECKADYYSVNVGFNPRSLFYYQKAIDLATANGLTIESGIYIFKKGLYFNTFKMYVPACQNFLKALDVFKSVGPENVPGVAKYLSQVAEFYYNLDDLETSKSYLLQALSYHNSIPREEINMINTVGLIYRSTGRYNEALKYFNQSLQLANKSNDSTWKAIAAGNIGSVYFLQKKYDIALPYINKDYIESIKYGENTNGAIALQRLAAINADRKNYATALSQLEIIDTLLKKRGADPLPLRPDYALKQRIDLYALRAAIYEQINKPALALFYRKKYDEVKEMLNSKNDALAVERIKIKWETDKEQLQIKQLSTAANAEKIKRNALVGVLLLLIVISVLIYNRQKLVIKKDKAILEKQEVALQLEISRAEQERKNARLALMDYTDQLRIKNDIIESFKTELDNMQRRTDPLYQYRASQLEDMMNAHIMTDKAWHEFKALFEKVHPSFFTLLDARFPGNTEADMRLLALIRLKLNNREMAGMLGITIEGVKKAKQRLRKKTGLPEDDGLETLIAES